MKPRITSEDSEIGGHGLGGFTVVGCIIQNRTEF